MDFDIDYYTENLIDKKKKLNKERQAKFRNKKKKHE